MSTGERAVGLVDLPAFDRPSRLLWQQAAVVLHTAGLLGGYGHQPGPAIALAREADHAREVLGASVMLSDPETSSLRAR